MMLYTIGLGSDFLCRRNELSIGVSQSFGGVPPGFKLKLDVSSRKGCLLFHEELLQKPRNSPNNGSARLPSPLGVQAIPGADNMEDEAPCYNIGCHVSK